jgi:hypothetical protein
MQAVARQAEVVKEDERSINSRTLVLKIMSTSQFYWGGSSATGSS